MDKATTRYYRQFRKGGYPAHSALWNARMLAWADANDVEFSWEDDPEECMGCECDQCSEAKGRHEWTHEVCFARLGDETNAIGCVDGATDLYRLDVQANLASDFRAEQEARDSHALDLVTV